MKAMYSFSILAPFAALAITAPAAAASINSGMFNPRKEGCRVMLTDLYGTAST